MHVLLKVFKLFCILFFCEIKVFRARVRVLDRIRVWLFNRLLLTTKDIQYPKKYAHGFVVLCFVVVMQSFIMNSHEVFIHIHQGWFAGTGTIVRLPQCQWSKPDGYGKISQCITTTKHSKAKTVCIFLGIYCIKAVFNNKEHTKEEVEVAICEGNPPVIHRSPHERSITNFMITTSSRNEILKSSLQYVLESGNIKKYNSKSNTVCSIYMCWSKGVCRFKIIIIV